HNYCVLAPLPAGLAIADDELFRQSGQFSLLGLAGLGKEIEFRLHFLGNSGTAIADIVHLKPIVGFSEKFESPRLVGGASSTVVNRVRLGRIVRHSKRPSRRNDRMLISR